MQKTVYALLSDVDISGVQEDSEETVGAVAVRKDDSNNAPRKEITLQSACQGWNGNMVLSRSNTKVKVYDASSGGNEITFNGTDNKFANSSLPKTLYVAGYSASASMRDVSLELYPENLSSCKDTVKFTVLWVTVTCDHSGTVNNDNARQALYGACLLPPQISQFDLGYQWDCYQDEVGFGLNSEFLGTVAPSDFNPKDFASGSYMYMARTKDSSALHDDQTLVESSSTSTDDTSPAEWRDDDPQSDGSNGVIYDLDAPGLVNMFADSTNQIWRFRANFTASAKYYDATESVYIRCSEKWQWYTRQSYKKTGNEDWGTATSGSATTLTDNTKSWGVNGWVPDVVGIFTGTGSDPVQIRRVTGNTATQLTVTGWDTSPDSTSGYDVMKKSTWTQENSVSGDNQSGNGTTNTTWNLQ